MPKYSKPPLSPADQIAYLITKGLTITDPASATQYLARVGLYRFKGYAYFFIDPGTKGIAGTPSRYRAGTTFEDVKHLMDLDEELKLHLLKGVQTFEIHFRVALNEHLCHTYGPTWYIQTSPFQKEAKSLEFGNNFYSSFKKSSEIFIENFKKKYDPETFPPSWMVIEILSFGTWSRIYAELQDADMTTIATVWGISKDTLQYWLKQISILRNFCAHHSRVWNRTYATMPVHDVHPPHLRTNLRNNSFHPLDKGAIRLAPRLFAMHHIIKVATGNTNWTDELKTILAKFTPALQNQMGFRAGWERQPEWT